MPVFSPFMSDALSRAKAKALGVVGLGDANLHRAAIRAADPESREDWVQSQADLRGRSALSSYSPFIGLTLGTLGGLGYSTYGNLGQGGFVPIIKQTYTPFKETQKAVQKTTGRLDKAQKRLSDAKLNATKDKPVKQSTKNRVKHLTSRKAKQTKAYDAAKGAHFDALKFGLKRSAPWMLLGAGLGLGAGYLHKKKKDEEREASLRDYAKISPALKQEIEQKAKSRKALYGGIGL